MLIATFRPDSSEPRKITREDDHFELEGHGPISASHIMDYDEEEQLRWENSELRDWVRLTTGSADGFPQLTKDLAEAVSGAAEVQNKYWIAVAIISLFVLIPRPEAAGAEVKLPFELPAVRADWFMLVGVLLLGVLITAFAAAQAHLVRTQRLARGMLQSCDGDRIAARNVRDVFEALRKPSLTRVSSIALVFMGLDQFRFDKTKGGLWRRLLAKVTYAVLKILVLVVWLILPAFALGYAVHGYFAAPLDKWYAGYVDVVVVAVAAAAGLSLFVSTLLEFIYLLGTVFDHR